MPGPKNLTSIYKLGCVSFSIRKFNQGFLLDLETLVPHHLGEPTEAMLEVDTEQIYDLRSLQNHILAQHHDFLWFDAGCVISPNGKKVLIVGRSGAGKSTTTIALALGYDWKVIAEDILLIDLKRDELITFGAPFSLKPGTAELLMECIGRVPTPIFSGEWSPLGSLADYGPNNAKFDFAIIFGDRAANQPMNISSISSGEFVRKVLPVSNILRLEHGAEKLLQYLSTADCFEIKHGTLRERLDALLRFDDEPDFADTV